MNWLLAIVRHGWGFAKNLPEALPLDSARDRKRDEVPPLDPVRERVEHVYIEVARVSLMRWLLCCAEDVPRTSSASLFSACEGRVGDIYIVVFSLLVGALPQTSAGTLSLHPARDRKRDEVPP